MVYKEKVIRVYWRVRIKEIEGDLGRGVKGEETGSKGRDKGVLG